MYGKYIEQFSQNDRVQYLMTNMICCDVCLKYNKPSAVFTHPSEHICAAAWLLTIWQQGHGESLTLQISLSLPSSVVPPPALPLPHFRQRTLHAEPLWCSLSLLFSPPPSFPPSITSFHPFLITASLLLPVLRYLYILSEFYLSACTLNGIMP